MLESLGFADLVFDKLEKTCDKLYGAIFLNKFFQLYIKIAALFDSRAVECGKLNLSRR